MHGEAQAQVRDTTRTKRDTLRGRGVSRSDLIQEGCLALVRLVDRCDIRKQHLFASTVFHKAQARMLRAIRKRRKLREGQVRLSERRAMVARVSDPFLVFWSVELEAEFERLMGELSGFDRAVLEYRYGLGSEPRRTLDETGRMLNVPPQRVERTEFIAIARLRRRAKRLLPLLRAG